MTRLERATRDTFRSLRSRNYRLFFLGQAVSISGTWMQGIAQAWLVLQLTGSGTAPSSEVPRPGFVPPVTNGPTSPAARTTTVSYAASSVTPWRCAGSTVTAKSLPRGARPPSPSTTT